MFLGCSARLASVTVLFLALVAFPQLSHSQTESELVRHKNSAFYCKPVPAPKLYKKQKSGTFKLESFSKRLAAITSILKKSGIKKSTIKKNKDLRTFIKQCKKGLISLPTPDDNNPELGANPFLPFITSINPSNPVASQLPQVGGYYVIGVLGGNFFAPDEDENTPESTVLVQFDNAPAVPYPAIIESATAFKLQATNIPLGTHSVIIWVANVFENGIPAILSEPFNFTVVGDQETPNVDGPPSSDPCDNPLISDLDQDGFDGPSCGGTDCNDGNAAISPAAYEVCGDGIDNDCKGGDKSCPSSTFNYPLTVYEAYPNPGTPVAHTNDIVSMGFALPEGQISDTSKLRITGSSATQFTKLASWPDGSIKWVLLDFVLPSLSAAQKITGTYALDNGGSGNSGGGDICTLNNGVIDVYTGAMTAQIIKTGFNVLNLVQVGGNTLVAPGNSGRVEFMNELGAVYNSSAAALSRFDVRQNGPVRCQVVVEGELGTSNLRYRLIYDFYRNKTKVDISASLLNDKYSSKMHQLARYARVVVDTTLSSTSGSAINAEAAKLDNSPTAYTIPLNNGIRVSNWYSSAHETQEEGNAGYSTAHAGYAVEQIDNSGAVTSTLLARSTAAQVPGYQWLTISQGGSNIRATNRLAGYYYPNGLSAKSDGSLAAELFVEGYPALNALQWRMAKTRHFELEFNATDNALNRARAYTNQLMAIPADKTHLSIVGGLKQMGDHSISPSTLAAFYAKPNVNIDRPVCSNSQDSGPNSWGGLHKSLRVIRMLATGLTGGGVSNNMGANDADITFAGEGLSNFIYARELAQYRADTDTRMVTGLTLSDLTSTSQKNLFMASATNEAYLDSQIGISSLETKGADENHNWAPQMLLFMYHLSGREEYAHGLQSVFYWLRTNGFSNTITYTRALGMQLMGWAHLLNYFSETGDPKFTEHYNWLRTFLISKLLYAVATPDYGAYNSNTCLNNDCFGYHVEKAGWPAPPGQDYVPASTAPTEIKNFSLDVRTFWHGFGSGNGLAECQDGDRAFTSLQRLAAGLRHVYESLRGLDPADTLLNDIALRVRDMARHAAGKYVGKGMYELDFANPLQAGLGYRYCPYNKEKNYFSGGDNAYVIAHIFAFAARVAATQAEEKFWLNAAVNQIMALEAQDQMECFREFDSKIQEVIYRFLESGYSYDPEEYPKGSLVEW